MIRILGVLCVIAGVAHAETIDLRVVGTDERAGELAAIARVRLEAAGHRTVTTPPPAPPRELATAIALFRGGDCAGARIAIAAARRAETDDDGDVRLWEAGIAQRCGEAARAMALLDALAREVPSADVDLTELWPSLAAALEQARARVRPASASAQAIVDGSDRERIAAIAWRAARRSAAPVVVLVAAESGRLRAVTRHRDGTLFVGPVDAVADPAATLAWLVARLAPRARARGEAVDLDLDLGVQLVGIAHETAAATRRGSGLGARVELRRATWIGDATSRVVADAAGWRWSSELRAGARATLLARRLELAALAFAGADVGDEPAWLGAGVTGRILVRPVRALEGSFELGVAPVALRTRDDAMELPEKVVSRLGAGWQYAPAWRVHLGYEHEVLRGVVAMQLALALIYRT